MKTLFVVAALLSLAPVAAATDYSGSVVVGHPLTGFTGGVTEIAEGCQPGGLTSGLDGQWFEIGAAEGLPFTLTMDETLDADVWFYSASCGYISFSDGAQNGFGVVESGVVPASAAYAIVDGFAGSGGFTLTIG